MMSAFALCPVCRHLLGLATVRPGAVDLPRAKLPVMAAGRYEHELARCLLAFKNSGRTDLVKYLAPALVRSVLLVLGEVAAPGRQVALVPLPSTRAATRRRGFAPAPELTRYAVRQLRAMGYPVRCVEALAPTRSLPSSQIWGRGSSQKALGQDARFSRMQGQLKVGSPRGALLGRAYDLTNLTCIVTDDVVTTGASMTEAHRVLQEAGATVVAGAAIAYVPKRQQVRGEE
ncbi:ComF family protein [Rothia nasimurium]|uniref:ComF family protein n=1 Tax=Rothia nasimurium TaxID=85336 RepID=UPI003B9F8643